MRYPAFRIFRSFSAFLPAHYSLLDARYFGTAQIDDSLACSAINSTLLNCAFLSHVDLAVTFAA